MSRAILAALPLALLAACVTTTDRERSVDNKGASEDNVELGIRYMQQGNLQTAKEKLDRAAKQDPKSPKVYWATAALNEAMNLPKEADRNYQKALDLDPANSNIVNTYAVFLCRQGEVDRAVKMFDKVIADKLYPTPYAAAANAGVCLRGDKRNADAERYFERALALGPTFADAVVGLADLQISQGKPEAARKTVEGYMASGSKSPDVLVVAVRATVVQHDCTTAQLYARILRREFPNSAQAGALPQVLSVCASASN
jgi:type IV pilus assembly protein PilF